MTNTSHKIAMLRPGFELKQGPLTDLTEFCTSLEHLFYVTHMGVSALSPDNWQMSVSGMVKRPLLLNWADLARYPRQRLLATHECAGSPMRPTMPVRRVGNVEWEGIPLTALLEEAGVLPEARFMWSTGADWGEFFGVYSPSYQKDLPIDVAQRGQVLLATHANGQPLAPERGAPLRLVVPDFYGTNSTKWLTALELQDQRAPGHYTQNLYNDQHDGVRQPVWALAPHAVIVSHADGQLLRAGQHQVWGWGWASGGVAQVEMSFDGGANWQVVALDARIDHAWQKFSAVVQCDAGAQHWLCRATANDGRVQAKNGARNEWFGLTLQVIDPA